jgi:hypothetical protein
MTDRDEYDLYVNDRVVDRFARRELAVTHINATHKELLQSGYYVTDSRVTRNAEVWAEYRRSRRDSEMPASFGGGMPTKMRVEIRPRTEQDATERVR